MELHVQQLAEATRPTVESTIIVANSESRMTRELINGISVRRVATYGRLASSPLTWGMSEEIAATDADLVHLHAPNPIAMSAWLRSHHPAPLVITHHADIMGRKRIIKAAIWPIWKACMDKAKAIIVSSPAVAEHSKELRPYTEKLHVVPLGIDYGFLDRVAPYDVDLARRYSPFILAVGRLVPFKGFNYLIKAMYGIKAKLVLIGSGPDAPRLHRMARLTNNVIMPGALSWEHLAPYYRAAEMFVLPSCERRETFGLVQLEAMHCGLPVINTSIKSAVPEVSKHGITGLTVKPRCYKELRSAIQFLLSNRTKRQEFSANAIHRAREFTAPRMANGTLSVYEQVLTGLRMYPAAASLVDRD